MIELLALAASALIAVALIAILNSLSFPRLGAALRRTDRNAAGAYSILIPARDEAGVIESAVRGWLAQAGAAEVIVLDDGSTDGTGEAAERAGAGDPRLRVIRGRPLPPGWLGKNWACHQLAEAARTEALLFTDADVECRPGLLPALTAEQERTGADLLTVWPTQITRTWSERLVVPLIAMAIQGYLPAAAAHQLPWPIFAAATGQCLLFRRAAYQNIAGHAAVRAAIVEDVALARRVKSAGLRLRAADGDGLIFCRMYRSWPEVRDGLAKNLLAGLGGPAQLVAATLFHWLLFVAPWLLALGLAAAAAFDPAVPVRADAFLLALSLAWLGVLIRALTAAATCQRLVDALLMPVSVVLMTAIAARSLSWHLGGGPRWKGRTYARPGQGAEA